MILEIPEANKARVHNMFNVLPIIFIILPCFFFKYICANKKNKKLPYFPPRIIINLDSKLNINMNLISF